MDSESEMLTSALLNSSRASYSSHSTMFTIQATMKKRDRDESDAESDSEGGRYKRCIKRTRSGFDGFTCSNMQYFTSPISPHRPSSLTPSPPELVADFEEVTPVLSESEWPRSPRSIQDDPLFSTSQSSCIDYSMEMENDDVESQLPSSPALSSFSSLLMRPAMLDASLFGSDSGGSGRMPTPIHPTFRRGNMRGIGHSTALACTLSEENICASSSILEPLSRSDRQEMEQDQIRCMPSPIREDDDVPDTPTAVTQSQLSRLSFSQFGDQMETDVCLPVSDVPPTPRTRKRSGALTGMGRFSMGYREDCKKCQQRVPGHYSHFLP